jgi:serine/threonine protein kinase
MRVPRIPGYELIQLLGGGPLTGVFSARECATDTLCAVKLLRDEWQKNSTAIKFLQREARAALSVHHPHLIRTRHAHVTRPPYFLVMDLLPGESLRGRLRRDYRVDVPAALSITRQTAEALAALHRVGFLHGDVKPDNIRLVDAGTAVLIDLGFAHRPGENTRLRQHGYLLGTPDYLAPEMCRLDADGDLSSDLFSLGVTLFEMLTGRLPYPAGSTRQTLESHCSASPLDIRSLAVRLPASLVALIGRLLQRRPADRPRASAVVQQLITLEISTLKRRRSA